MWAVWVSCVCLDDGGEGVGVVVCEGVGLGRNCCSQELGTSDLRSGEFSLYHYYFLQAAMVMVVEGVGLGRNGDGSYLWRSCERLLRGLDLDGSGEGRY